jgi:hypothetical protein
MYKLKVDRDIGASICGSGFINYSLKCCHSDSSYAMNFHNFSGHFHHWDFHLDLSIWQEDMQIEPPSSHKNQAIPCPAALEEEPSSGFPADPIQWSALNTDHSTWSWGWAGFSMLLYGEWDSLSVWVDMSERKNVSMWQLPEQDSLCLQVSIVRCRWWRLEVIWFHLGGPETLLRVLWLLSCN